MRDFSKVSPQIWDSERFRTLADDSARLAYLYLLSNGHQNSVGCYRLPSAYACADLGWEPPKYAKVLEALIAAELIGVDGQTHEILILRWFKHNPPTNAKHAQGAFRLVDKIQSPPLRDQATTELQTAWEKWQAEHSSGGGTPVAVSTALLEANRRRAAGGR